MVINAEAQRNIRTRRCNDLCFITAIRAIIITKINEGSIQNIPIIPRQIPSRLIVH
jgi:hypothetical protein